VQNHKKHIKNYLCWCNSGLINLKTIIW